jgi:acyl-CoA dehydrogenase
MSNDDLKMVQQAARDFVAGRSSTKRVRALRDEGTWSRELWGEMARLGWLGLLIPEAHGGSELGARYAVAVGEELGRGLIPEPYLSTVWLGSTLLAGRGAELAKLAGGELLVAFADLGEARSLDGAATCVLGGATADVYAVATREGVHLIEKGAPGVSIERQHLIDGRDAAIVRFAGARGTSLGGPELAARARDAGALGLAADLLGVMGAVFEMTLAYLKTRVQFGAPIGSFQALQHRAARLYMELELARSIVHHAADTMAPRDIAAAKAKCSDAAMLVAHEGVQLHGGIGMTDEHDVGLYLKRARAGELLFGDAVHHRERFAALGGW